MVKREKQSRYLHGGLNFGYSIPDHAITGRVFLHGHDMFECGDEKWDAACNETTCLENVIGFESRFYYQIEEHNNRQLVSWEKGIGYLEKENSLVSLVRETPVRYFNGGEPGYYRPEAKGIRFKRDSLLKIQSVSPQELREATAAPYSVVATMESQRLTPVHMEEDTLLGRKDDIIQSIDKEEFKEMMKDAIIESFTESQKQHDVKTRRINLTRKNAVISTPVVRLAPDNYNDTEKPPAQQGMVIYNTDKKCLEFFNGDKWIRIAEED